MDRVRADLFRLRSLRDLTVLRARMGDPGLTALVLNGFAKRRYIPHSGEDSTKCDFIITPEGREYASRVLK